MYKEKIFLGVDDTDGGDHPMGTGKLARLLGDALEKECSYLHCAGVIRHQLLVDPRIPYTNHNSPACIMMNVSRNGVDYVDSIKKIAFQFVISHSAPVADPGVCIVPENQINEQVIHFGIMAGAKVLSKDKAMQLAKKEYIELYDLGGTGDGIIGALSAVGLTKYGYAGRFLEYKGILRNLSDTIPASELFNLGIKIISLNRDAEPVCSETLISTENWLRPRLIGGEAVLFVIKRNGTWHCFDQKSKSLQKGDQ